MEATKERIKWRSRRGLLELDIVLTRFLTKYLDNLSVQEQDAMLDLLTCDDIELWGMVSKKVVCQNTYWQELICKLQQAASYGPNVLQRDDVHTMSQSH